MKGLCLAQRQALLWILQIVFYGIVKSLSFPASTHFLDLATKAQQDLKPNKRLTQQQQKPN